MRAIHLKDTVDVSIGDFNAARGSDRVLPLVTTLNFSFCLNIVLYVKLIMH